MWILKHHCVPTHSLSHVITLSHTVCDDSQNLNETESETFFFQYQTFTILNPICFNIIFLYQFFLILNFFSILNPKHPKNWKVLKPRTEKFRNRLPKYPKSERNWIWIFLIPNIFYTESDSFSDSKFFRYRIRHFFRYQFFYTKSETIIRMEKFQNWKVWNRNVTLWSHKRCYKTLHLAHVDKFDSW